jgi:hypothetical protein
MPPLPPRSGARAIPDHPLNLFKGYNGALTMGILPVSVFCSGHTYYTQRMFETLKLQVGGAGRGGGVAGHTLDRTLRSGRAYYANRNSGDRFDDVCVFLCVRVCVSSSASDAPTTRSACLRH